MYADTVYPPPPTFQLPLFSLPPFMSSFYFYVFAMNNYFSLISSAYMLKRAFLSFGARLPDARPKESYSSSVLPIQLPIASLMEVGPQRPPVIHTGVLTSLTLCWSYVDN